MERRALNDVWSLWTQLPISYYQVENPKGMLTLSHTLIMLFLLQTLVKTQCLPIAFTHGLAPIRRIELRLTLSLGC